jgi:hypothetical protein
MFLVRVVNRLVACLLIDKVFLVNILNRYSIKGSSPFKYLLSSALDIYTRGETSFCAFIYPVGLVLMFLFKERCYLLGLYSLADHSP